MLKNLNDRINTVGTGMERITEFQDVLARDGGTGGNAINTIMESPWFKRIWIQQEFIAALHVDFMYWSAEWTSVWGSSSALAKGEFQKDLPGSDGRDFSAGSTYNSSLSFRTHGFRELLTIRNLHFDHILAYSEIIPVISPQGNSFDFLLSAAENVKSMIATCSSLAIPTLRDIIRALLQNRPPKYSGLAMFNSLNQTALPTNLMADAVALVVSDILHLGIPAAGLRNFDMTLHESMVFLQNSRVFITCKGNLGVGLPGLRNEVSAVIFYGAEIPFIFREDRTHWGEHRLQARHLYTELCMVNYQECVSKPAISIYLRLGKCSI
ncbi:hypothetical protein F5Y16DRAFT_399910 [Xylariaceae sp. FL0255]|nr:hypothetical protein F5Y16DRAFT_399910 [Xylariaceae sp. FL0255]